MLKALAKLLVTTIVLCANGRRKTAFRAIVRAAGLPARRAAKRAAKRVFVIVDTPARNHGGPLILGDTSKD